MSEPSLFRVGGVLSADIAVPEHEREVRFYSRVLCTGEKPLWREDLMNNRGMPIIGLGPRNTEYAHLPLQWMPHIQVADVAASVQRAVEHGGRELMHARGDDGKSQWAVLIDPNGAAFGIIPVIPAGAMPPGDGSTSQNADESVGCIKWLDLTVANAAATREFYQHVIGWSVQEVEREEGGERYSDFTMLGGDGHPAAAIRHARGTNAGLPPVWIISVPVGDLAESLRRVPEEGGKVIQTTPAANGGCASAVIQDPVGAYLGLLPG